MKIILMLGFIFFLNCKEKVSDKKIEKKEPVSFVNGDNIKNQKRIKDCNETFDEFFERFAKDSVFQKDRLKYPFRYLSGEYDFNKRKDTIICNLILNKKDFDYIDFTEDKDAMDKEFDKYSIFIEDLGSIINYKLRGYDNGIRVTYKFMLIEGCWYMVEILDEST